MKLVIDERLKHRLIGIAVIVSIGTIFAPALIKKSSHRFDEDMSITLPLKPPAPKLAMPEKERVFQSMKVAHVEIPDVPAETKPLAKAVPKAESISTLNDLKTTIVTATKEGIKPSSQLLVAEKPKSSKPITVITKPTQPNTVILASNKQKPLPKQPDAMQPKNKLKEVILKTAPSPKTSTIQGQKGAHYAVQLGLFSQQNNAIALVNKLKSKGYAAAYTKVKGKKGIVYRVIVGQLNQKQQAVLLQQRLAKAIQMEGFIVTTRIS
ncbi:Sporulation domain-containing protein [Legionella beliardensis]|uniref:Sporulation domain-containing protein n=1 Tax=Legionella beliardensis TaxID=91822 RepID=A0A378I260_9GAMM|nr:SPOR domain-containing protein [Legionella beliardensis]STX29083.1 Sporulation domain-containing protein [Legionella beliardensis]